MHPIVISFYTLGTPYEKEVRRLIDSCVKFDIESDIEGVVSQGSWEKNCSVKPFFILQKLQQWKRPVLWVDADAAFLQPPHFDDFQECDFAVRINEFLPKNHESRIISNTIFAKDNSAAYHILEKWCETTTTMLNDRERVMEFWDQVALREVLAQEESTRVMPMPLKFSKIFDFDDLFISEQEVVIEHYQASRRRHVFSQHHCCH